MKQNGYYIKTLEAKGTRFYKAKLAYESGLLSEETHLILRHQPSNPYDKNAVGIYLKRNNMMLAHIPKEHAEYVKNLLHNNKIAWSNATGVNLTAKHVYFNCQIAITSPVQHTEAWLKALSISKQPGVYSITFKIDGAMYIGESGNIRNRLLRHLKEMDAQYHHNPPLQYIFNLHGSDSFEFNVLELISDKEVRHRRETEIIREFLGEGKLLLNSTDDGKAKSKIKARLSGGKEAYKGYIDAETLKWIEKMEYKNIQNNIDTVNNQPIKAVNKKTFFQKLFFIFNTTGRR